MPKASKSRRPGDQVRSTQRASPNSPPAKQLYRSKEISPKNRIISLVIGDILCFLIFASLGSNQHGEGFNPFTSLWVALPFMAAWFLIAPSLGAFRAEIATQPTRMVIRTALSWMAVWPIAMALRWLLVDRVSVHPVAIGSFLSFALVTLAFNMGLLLLWRWPFALNNDLRKRGY